MLKNYILLVESDNTKKFQFGSARYRIGAFNGKEAVEILFDVLPPLTDLHPVK